MEKEKLLNEIVWNLEMAEARLSDDIRFLHCVDEEYLVHKEPKESLQYLYQQLSAMIATLIKSMEYNQMEMQNNINKYYEQVREKNVCKS